MSFKRNMAMYIKEKSTLTAALFLLIFIIVFSLSLIDSLWYKKGISDEFENYKITYMNSNNNSVIYAASNNVMFYSQNKEHKSTLNDFTGVEAYTNAYVGANYKPYNFVKINYVFPSKIKEIKGITDNLLGERGETYVLTEDGGLYTISSRSNKVENLLSNVKKFEVKYDSTLNKNTILVLDKNNLLSLYYFNFQVLVKHELYQGYIDDFYLLGANNIFIRIGDDLFCIWIKTSEEYDYIDDYPYDYKIYKNNYFLEHTDFRSEKLVNIGDSYYSLYNNEIEYFEYDKEKEDFIKYDDGNYSIKYQIDAKINDIYVTGFKSLIIDTNKGIYYLGDIKYFNSQDRLTKFEYTTNKIYASRNSLIYLDEKGFLNIYNEDTNSFDVMYQKTLLKEIIKYFSLFVIGMTLFYIILSFIESNKRYNRYFKVNKTK